MLHQASQHKMYERHVDWGSIYSATIGVLFLGTPHRGSSEEPVGQMVAIAAKVALHDPNFQLLGTLAENSHILEKQRGDFVTISKDLEIVCFYEEFSTVFGMVRRMVRQSISDGCSGELIELRHRLSQRPRQCMRETKS